MNKQVKRIMHLLVSLAFLATTMLVFAGSASAASGSWTNLAGPTYVPVNSGLIRSLTAMGGTLYAGGEFDTGGVWSWNGSDWSQVDDFVSLINSMTSVNDLIAVDGVVYAGTGGYGVWGWNGSAWSHVGGSTSPLGSGNVSSLSSVDGAVYAGTTDGVWAWNGSVWSRVGSGPSGTVNALATGGGRLYANNPGTGVWSWDGSAWSLMPGSPSNFVWALASFNGTLYAGTNNGVSSWDGSAWSQVDLPGGINCLKVLNGTLYAGGYGGVWALDGSSWSELGSSVRPDTQDLTMLNGVLYAGSANGVWSWTSSAPEVTGVSPASGQAGTTVTVNGTGFTSGSTVNFGGNTATGVTFISANQMTALAPEGSGTVDVTVTGPNGMTPTSPSDRFTYIPDSTAITLGGATSADYDDPVTITATLNNTSSNPSVPVAGVGLTLTLGNYTATTDANGVATFDITPDQAAGTYSLEASFAGNSDYQASTATESFMVNPEETSLSLTSPTAVANGGNVTVSATLLEDGSTAVAGRTVTFTLGSQTVTGETDARGQANGTFTVNQPLGPETVSASFAGDSDYLPASASGNTVVFAYLNQGAFVIGDQTGTVNFWGAQWSKNNSLSAPASFKGFASQVNGSTWSTTGGNSSNPPDTLPAYMAVIVSNSVSKSGSVISGNIVSMVVVKTDLGYAPNPGHAGYGTVVATIQ